MQERPPILTLTGPGLAFRPAWLSRVTRQVGMLYSELGHTEEDRTVLAPTQRGGCRVYLHVRKDPVDFHSSYFEHYAAPPKAGPVLWFAGFN